MALVSTARADQHGLVVILGPSSDHPTVAQVRNELLLLGFDVSVLWSAAPVGKLDGVGRRYGAAAVARVLDWPPEVVVWVAPERDALPQKAASEIYVSDSLAEPASHRLLALGAVELLRGRLLRVPPAEGSTPSAPTPPPPKETVPTTGQETQAPKDGGGPRADRTIPAEGGHRATMRLRPGALLGPSGMPATPHVYPGATFDLGWRLGIDVDLLIPTTAGAITADEGRVDVRTLLLLGGLSMGLSPPESRWLARAGLGAGAAGLFFAGEADAPYEGRDGSQWAFAPYASLAGGYYVHPTVALRADALVSVLLPEPIVRIADQEVATLGRPAVVLGAGVEVRP
ncbi:MAG: hypothetical protein JRI23_17250 [Deltaproteobacteria bacterium]|jgi:hypothetical protein|nr:hypothetical protein [Deltaproteobacteria bacterium]MBW2533566.1 hypothetical protein [Deltaproteobacteria bacterium]